MLIRASMRTLLLAAVAVVIPSSLARAQDGVRPQYSASQALFTPGGGGGQMGFNPTGDLVDAHGDRAVIPASYNMQAGPPGGGGYCYGEGMDPYASSYQTPQSGPHYFDVSVDYLLYRRENVFNDYQAFTTLNFAADPADDVVVLSSDDLNIDDESGFRVTGRLDLGPLSVVEFGYSGLFDMNATAQFADPDAPVGNFGNLFSPFTDFGRNPSGGVVPSDPNDPQSAPTDDFQETDRARLHRVSFDSSLQTAEISYRRYWVGYSPRISGTWLAGFRYTSLRETFNFHSEADGTFNYTIDADNDLAGFQTGLDGWITIVQGLRIGAEGKVGIYDNHYEVDGAIRTTDGTPTIDETFRGDQVAFLTEGKVSVIADITPCFSAKIGYEILFMDQLALAGDNFNTEQPYGVATLPAREPYLNDNGDVLFHGLHAGLEYVW